jgi:hypothetical protein
MGRLLAVIVGFLVPLAVVSSTGCAQLVGIDDTNDSARVGNSLRITRMSIGKTVVEEPLDLTGLRASYLVNSQTSESGFERVDAVNAGDGTWTTRLPEPTPIEFTLPESASPPPRVHAFPSRALSTLFPVLEHANRSPAPDGATLAVMVDLDRPYASADRFQVYTLGSWTSRTFAAAEILQVPDMGAVQVSTLQPYMFASSSNIAGRPQLDRLTVDDAFLILRYVGAALTGVAEAAPFNQTGNDVVMATGPRAMVAVPQDQRLDLKLETNLVARYTAVRPAVGGLAMSWSLVAAPGYRIASSAGPSLHSGTLMATDLGLVVAYGNPFVDRDWRTIFTLATTESRTFTLPGTTLTVTLLAGMSEFIEPSPGYTVKLDAGLPTLIMLGSVQLSVDGQTIPKPTRMVPVSFSPDREANTLYSLQVHDLVPNMAGTAVEVRVVFVGTSHESRFNIPPEIFQAGHSYTMRALTTLNGHPSASTGDLADRELPMAQSFFDSAVFTVMPVMP